MGIDQLLERSLSQPIALDRIGEHVSKKFFMGREINAPLKQQLGSMVVQTMLGHFPSMNLEIAQNLASFSTEPLSPEKRAIVLDHIICSILGKQTMPLEENNIYNVSDPEAVRRLNTKIHEQLQTSLSSLDPQSFPDNPMGHYYMKHQFLTEVIQERSLTVALELVGEKLASAQTIEDKLNLTAIFEYVAARVVATSARRLAIE